MKGKRLDKDYFNTLLTGGDPVRDLLQWLDQGDAFKTGRDENDWKAFVEVCKSQLAFNPENDGILKGAELLAGHKGPWHPVWERFCEAPKRYPNIPAQIRKCKPPSDTIFWHTADNGSMTAGPNGTKTRRKTCSEDLLVLNNLPAHEARGKLLETGKAAWTDGGIWCGRSWAKRRSACAWNTWPHSGEGDQQIRWPPERARLARRAIAPRAGGRTMPCFGRWRA